MKTENVDFVDALKIMADRAGIVLPEDDEGFNDELREKKKKLYLMNKIAARFFYDRFKDKEELRNLVYSKDVISMIQDGFYKILAGFTTITEVLKISPQDTIEYYNLETGEKVVI